MSYDVPNIARSCPMDCASSLHLLAKRSRLSRKLSTLNGTAAASFDSGSRLNPMVDRCSWISRDRQVRATSLTPCSRCDCQRSALRARGVFEIAGCFAFWIWQRRGDSPAVALVGVASLVAFAFMLTRINSAFAGRAYAAYGGIYIVASLAWLWIVEGQAPTRTDLAEAALA